MFNFNSKKIILVFISMFVIISPAFAQSNDLGVIDFPTSGSPEAQKYFIRGVLLMHSFEYRDAGAEFKKAREIEPGFAMAYWGEAMTHNHPVWNQQNKSAAKKIMKGLASTAEERMKKVPTQREKEYWRALEVLYGDGDKISRDYAYSEAMKQLYEKYPEDLEAASFYALSTLGTVQGKRDFRTYVRSGAIAQEVFGKNPLHPGAAHYVIHSFDDPIHAPLGLKAARVYSNIAPDAPHALHMPSHIFMALGMWDDSASLNERSAAAAFKKGQNGLHPTWWLHYTYLQQGRYEEARKLLAEVEKKMNQTNSRSYSRHAAYMRSSFIVETRNWREANIGNFDASSLGTKAMANVLLVNGFAAIEFEKIDKATKILDQLKELISTEQKSDDLELVQLMHKELEAFIQFKMDNDNKALALLQDAIALQDNMRFEFGPPIPVKPVHELFGEVLLQLNQPEEAKREFKISLTQNSNRALSLLGLARANSALGDSEASRKAYSELKEIWHNSDDLPELQEINSKLVQVGSQ